MESLITNLGNGFHALLTLTNILIVLVGCVLGTVVGILPGLGPAATMAILLPLTLGMDPAGGLILLTGIIFGAQYGGSTTSILLHIPGEASAVITCIEGYEMTKKGRAGAALTSAAIGSFIAATLSFICLTMVAMPLARAALTFGPPEFFSIAFVGLLVLSNVTGGSSLKNLLMVLTGIMLSTIGMDSVSGLIRFDLGYYELSKGIGYIPVLMGIFGMGEILNWVITKGDVQQRLPSIRIRDLYPTHEEWRRMMAPIFRGGVIGFLLGLIPGPAGITCTYASYALEKRISKRPEEFGHGAIEGVAGPESANNANVIGIMVPLLSLGLPFSGYTAMLLGALQMQGITPGPLFIVQNADIFWLLIASFYLGNMVLLCFNLPMVSVFALVLRTPMWILMSLVTILCIVGTYSLGNDLFDVWVMLGSGVVGFLMPRFGFNPAPLVLGMVFGPLLELSLIQSLLLFQGNVLGFWGRPISGVIISIPIISFFIIALTRWVRHRRRLGKP